MTVGPGPLVDGSSRPSAVRGGSGRSTSARGKPTDTSPATGPISGLKKARTIAAGARSTVGSLAGTVAERGIVSGTTITGINNRNGNAGLFGGDSPAVPPNVCTPGTRISMKALRCLLGALGQVVGAP